MPSTSRHVPTECPWCLGCSLTEDRDGSDSIDPEEFPALLSRVLKQHTESMDKMLGPVAIEARLEQRPSLRT